MEAGSAQSRIVKFEFTHDEEENNMWFAAREFHKSVTAWTSYCQAFRAIEFCGINLKDVRIPFDDTWVISWKIKKFTVLGYKGCKWKLQPKEKKAKNCH